MKLLLISEVKLFLNFFSGGRLLSLWQHAMCSKKGRESGRKILANVATDPMETIQAILNLIYTMISTPCDPDETA